MSDMDDVYYALQSGKIACEWLENKVQGIDARDHLRGLMGNITRGIAAYERVQTGLRDGRKHIEPPDDYMITSCQCGSPGAAPPCSWCTCGKERDQEEAEFFHPNDD